MKFDGYADPFRNDRDNLGGGICIAVRQEIKDNRENIVASQPPGRRPTLTPILKAI